MAHIKELSGDKYRIARLSSFLNAHNFHYADPSMTEDEYATIVARDHADTQILLIQEEPGFASKTRGSLRLFGEDVVYTTRSVIEAIGKHGLDPNDFINQVKKMAGSGYYNSEEYNAVLSSSLGAVVLGLSHLDSAAQAAISYLNPWSPLSIHVTPRAWNDTKRKIKEAGHTHEVVSATYYDDPVSIYNHSYYSPVTQINGTENIIFTGAAAQHARGASDIGRLITSLFKQARANTIQPDTARTWLTSLADRADNVAPAYEFGLPTQARVNELIANNKSRHIFFAKPDDIKSYRKTEEGAASKDRFGSTRIAKLGMYIFEPSKGDSLSQFWFYADKALDAWTLEGMVDHYIDNQTDVLTMTGAVNYKNTPKERYATELETDDVTTALTFSRQFRPATTGIGPQGQLSTILDIETKKALAQAIRIVNPMLGDGEVSPEDIGELAQLVFKQDLTNRFSKLYDAYMDALGGAVDTDMIKKTAFANYYDHLSKPQKVRLREYINQGEVNEDVLNNQPMTVWLLLATNSSLNRIRTKKSKLFDSMKFVVKPPKWLMNKVLEAPEGKITKGKLDAKKQLFTCIKRTWGSDLTWAWILHEEPKIFSDLSVKVLVQFLTYTNAIEAYEYDANVDYYTRSRYYYQADKLIAPPQGIGSVAPNYNFNKVRELYNEWANDLPEDTESKAYKVAQKQKEYEWKQFALEFRNFIETIFSRYTGTDGSTVFRPNTKSWTAIRDARNIGTEQDQFNDLFVSIAYLYGTLTGQSPLDGWVNFTSFIWQTNRWFADAEAWHNRQVELRNNNRNWKFRLKEDTEEFIRELTQQTGNWYEWRAANNRGYGYGYGNRLGQGALTDDGTAHIGNPATGLNPEAYKAVRDLFPLVVGKCRTIPKKGAVNVKDQKDNIYEEVPGVAYFEKDGLTITQILNEFDLREEGRNMNHCVGGFSNACELGASVIFHVQPTEPADPDGKAWPKNMTTTLEWMPKGTKREVYGKVVQLANDRATEYVQGQHYSFHNQTANQKNQDVARWLLRTWNRTMASEQFHFFLNLLAFFDKLAQLNGFRSFHHQLHPPKKVTKKKDGEEVHEETQIDKYYNKLQVALGNANPQPARHLNTDDQIQVNLI